MRDTAHVLLQTGGRMSGGAGPQADRDRGTLGTMVFAGAAQAADDAGPAATCLRVAMPRLDGGIASVEIWPARGRVHGEVRGDVHYSRDGDTLFGYLALQESQFDTAAGQTPLHRAAEFAYREAFSLLDDLGYRHIYRFWNYFPDINLSSHGLERYREFNLGREAAFVARGYDARGGYPAACALGSAHGPLCVAFLAGHVEPQRVENPRQVNAYLYPQQYGPRSPLFSRATLVSHAQEELLLISGTASVVGHATLHPGDVVAQTRETIANIQAVLAEANRLRPRAAFGLADLSCRVYVRRAQDLRAIQATLAETAGLPLQAAYLQADICRADLLLEIEATARRRSAPRAAGD
jgi:enamine deaminase RidA (YjgF/YER057c/UK114 family)